MFTTCVEWASSSVPTVLPTFHGNSTPVLSHPPFCQPCHMSFLKMDGSPGEVVFSLHQHTVAGSTRELTQLSLSASRSYNCVIRYWIILPKKHWLQQKKTFQSIATPPKCSCLPLNFAHFLVIFPVKGPPSSWLGYRAMGPVKLLYSQKGEYLIPLALSASGEMGLL